MLNDLRHAIRAFIRTPGFSVTAILTLALGIGANTAIFSVVYAVLLKPLPFPDAGALVYLHDTSPSTPVASVSWTKFVALRDGSATLSSLAAMAAGTLTVTGRGDPQRLQVLRVSGDYFRVLDIGPLAGRTITTADDVTSANPVIVLSYGLWQGSFGGAPEILGRTIITDGITRTVIGIMPPDFAAPGRGEAWVPLALSPDVQLNFLRLIGRLRPGVTLAQAAGDLDAVSVRFNRGTGLTRTVRIYRLQDFLSQGNSKILLVLQGAVLMVLLVACANVANMLLARSVVRRRELAIRTAMGASAWRILRQLLTESVLLSAGGGLAGVLLAGWLVRLVLALAPTGFISVQHVAIDRQVLLFTAAVALGTGLLFGLAPARRGFRLDASDGLRDAAARGATRSGLRGSSRVLVVAEIGLAIVLVAGAGLMVKSLQRLETEDAGFRPDGLLTFQIDLPEARYNDAGARRAIAQIAERVRGVPGVTAAGAVNFMPLMQFGYSGDFRIEGEPVSGPVDRGPITEFRMITPGYFSAMQIPLLAGADFSAADTANSRPVAIISDTLARAHFVGRSPIGTRIHLGIDEDDVFREIVGVAGSVRSNTLSGAPVAESYVPHAQSPPSHRGFAPASNMTFAVRAATDPTTLLPAIRAQLAAVDANLPLVRPRTMSEVVAASAGAARLSSTLASVFALLAALLAGVGVYSLVAYSIAQRTREIGIRIALGARPASVLQLILGEGTGLAAAGVACGLIGTVALAGTLRSLLFEVSPVDPLVLTATCIAVVILTLAATFVPAQRVMRVDPTVALRAE